MLRSRFWGVFALFGLFSQPGFAETSMVEGFGHQAVTLHYRPGETVAMHEHRHPRLVVVLEGGTLEVTAKDGKKIVIELKRGSVNFRPAETHAIKNSGNTTIGLMEMELPHQR